VVFVDEQYKKEGVPNSSVFRRGLNIPIIEPITNRLAKKEEQKEIYFFLPKLRLAKITAFQ
jgi:hypothetical protein